MWDEKWFLTGILFKSYYTIIASAKLGTPPILLLKIRCDGPHIVCLKPYNEISVSESVRGRVNDSQSARGGD